MPLKPETWLGVLRRAMPRPTTEGQKELLRMQNDMVVTLASWSSANSMTSIRRYNFKSVMMGNQSQMTLQIENLNHFLAQWVITRKKIRSGLAYVKALLIAHGGEITLLLTKDKVTFELTIPSCGKTIY